MPKSLSGYSRFVREAIKQGFTIEEASIVWTMSKKRPRVGSRSRHGRRKNNYKSERTRRSIKSRKPRYSVGSYSHKKGRRPRSKL